MTEIRLAIITVFVVLFWGWVLAIYIIIIMRGDWVIGIVGITALIPVTLMFWMKAREDWNS